MNKITVKDFNLKHTLESGQVFRFEEVDGYYYINAQHKLFKVKQLGNKLFYDGASQKFINSYFNLNQDLKPILRKIVTDKHMHKATTKYSGLRLINQDPWECLIAFLCSSASNIPKIKQNLDLLSKHFGQKIFLDHIRSFTFPRCGALNNLEKIKASKTGFRANYIHQANFIITEEFLESLKLLPYAEAKEQLMKLNGIGSKVADCVLLFSLGFTEAFPVDTWMTKAMRQLYLPDQKNVKEQDMIQFAQNTWGKNAGYAQQYLYHYSRMNGKEEII